MTLEDFFTLTEMKNGLTTCARVEELIGVMQKLNCVSNNVADTARQWSTAATTLSCTQNKECLNLFVDLNGLSFLNHWLQEALKCSRDVGDGEELINTLIGSLDKLPTNPEKLRSSGIFSTVEKLFSHSNVDVKERARILFDKWNKEKPRILMDKWNNRRENDKGCSREMEKDSSIDVKERAQILFDKWNNRRENDIGCSREMEKDSSIDAPSIECKHSVIEVAVENSSFEEADEGSCRVESGRIKNLKVTSDDDDHLQLGNADDIKCSSEAGQKEFYVQEGNLIPPKAEMAFSITTASPEMQVKDDEPFDTSVRHDGKAEGNEGKGDAWEFRETSGVVLSSSGLSATSHTKNTKVVRSASCNLTISGEKPILLDAKEALHRCASVDGVWLEYSKTRKEVKVDENDSTISLDSRKGSSWRKEADENIDDIDHCDEPTSNTFMHDDPPKTSNYDQVTGKMEKSSDSEPESGEMDALEIARLVAIEVEREVVDYREELCSSSPDVSSNEAMNAGRSSVEEDELGRPVLGEANGNDSVPIKDDCDVHGDQIFTDMATDPSKAEQIFESPNGGRAQMGKFDFDLNEDACTEDIDCAVNPLLHPNNLLSFSTPIAVSASKGAPLFLIAPQCFEGGLGWKGSAATSAFRPASPRRTFDGEKSEPGSKSKANLIELDLNVTDCENSIKEVSVSSGMPSWNSSSEVNSQRSERIKLDLNSNGEDEATPSHLPLTTHHFLNRVQNWSPPSSSSSLKQLPRKNFDLNDNLFSSDINLSKAANPHGVKLDDPVITIMGSRMSAERRAHHHPNQTQQSYIGNGLSFDSPLQPGPILPYPHQIPHPTYGYIPAGPGMTVPFQPSMYGFGNIPPMVDSRGTPVVPQLLSSAGPNGAPLTTLPYLMSITNTPSSSNGGGAASQPGLDLNFGMMPMENGNTAEQMNSGNSLKRKETESGWEHYNFGYKHLASRH